MKRLSSPSGCRWSLHGDRLLLEDWGVCSVLSLWLKLSASETMQVVSSLPQIIWSLTVAIERKSGEAMCRDELGSGSAWTAVLLQCWEKWGPRRCWHHWPQADHLLPRYHCLSQGLCREERPWWGYYKCTSDVYLICIIFITFFLSQSIFSTNYMGALYFGQINDPFSEGLFGRMGDSWLFSAIHDDLIQKNMKSRNTVAGQLHSRPWFLF
jgi:hypothetical protein